MLFNKSFLLSSLFALHVGCGDKHTTEEVKMENVNWENSNTDLIPGSFLALKGDLEGNKPFAVSFSIKDENGKDVPQNANQLSVSTNATPAGKTSLSLVDDMAARLIAGSDVCNGSYTLTVTAKVGQAESTKPLHFKVREGRDPSFCQQKSNFTQGKVYNIHGPSPGSFDLVNGRPVRVHDNREGDRDLLDLTARAKDTFKMTLGSGNGSMFVHTQLSENASDAEIRNEFQTKSKQAETNILRAGDVVIVEARDKNLYLLKITEASITASEKTGVHRTGAIKFDYRKIGSSNNV